MSELRALLVTPLSGPLARFGRAGAAALRLWAAEAADLPPPWRSVRLDLHDTHSDPAAAMRSGLASRPPNAGVKKTEIGTAYRGGDWGEPEGPVDRTS